MEKDKQAPRPVVLLILDGWGIAPPGKGNAVSLARKPNFDRLMKEYPSSTLAAAGEAVGLPEGEDGNSEVGHLNLGGGRVAAESLPRINLSIVDGSFFKNTALLSAVRHAKKNGSAVHLMGLVGSGSVHAYNDHLYALLRLIKQNEIKQLFLHIFTDGRDSPPTEAVEQVRKLSEELDKVGVGKIVTLMGRYYAMDRDLRWDRTEAAYRGLSEVIKNQADDPVVALERSYQLGITDEFVEPIQIGGDPDSSRIRDGDAVIFFNYRIDRPRQLTKALVLSDFERTKMEIKGFSAYGTGFDRKKSQVTADNTPFRRKVVLKNVLVVTMTEYEPGLPVGVAFPPKVLSNTLGEVVADAGIKQLRVAETEKERFVTFYFNGGQDRVFRGEDRLIVPSPQVSTYDLEPEMATAQIVHEAIQRMEFGDYGLVVINFACPDMVAHTGSVTATIKAVEAADEGIGKLVEAVRDRNGVLIITADHGNAEELVSLSDGQVNTEHSSNQVPFILVWDNRPSDLRLRDGILADVAPSILKVMRLHQPTEMDGRGLF